ADDRDEKAEAGRRSLNLVRIAQRGIDLGRQAARRASREMQELGLPARRRQWPVRGVTNDRCVIPVGDDEPGLGGQVAVLVEDVRQIWWHRPEETVAIIQIIEPFAIADKI